jgi:hypothetical protein
MAAGLEDRSALNCSKIDNMSNSEHYRRQSPAPSVVIDDSVRPI